MSRSRAPIWPEAVFHVLAHVNVPFASSCFDPVYVAWIREHLGPAVGRMLAEDADVLRRAASGHDVVARAQALAWVFDDESAVRAASDQDLASLDPASAGVKSAAALAVAKSAGPFAEVLRAAAELEMPLLRSAPWPAIDDDAIARALAAVAPCAPRLARDATRIFLTRPLGVRGRIFHDAIFVGVPGLACPDAEHIAWQAAHEATVAEVIEGAGHERDAAGGPMSFVETERRAIGLLRSRAGRSGLGAAHARWLSRFDLSGLGAIPDVEDGAG